MTKIYCDICGKEYNGETGWLLLKDPRPNNSLAQLCEIEDCCSACRNEIKNIDAPKILLEYWKSLAGKAGGQ